MTFKAVRDRFWRDFWKLWIPTMVIGLTIASIIDAPFLLRLVIVVAVGLILGYAAKFYWRRTRGPNGP